MNSHKKTRYLRLLVSLATSILAVDLFTYSDAQAAQRGHYFYVTGSDQDLVGTTGDDAIGFAWFWPDWAMNFADVQTLTQDFTLSGAWSGGPGIDQYFVYDCTFSPVVNQDENGNYVWYTGPQIHVSFDLSRIHINEADNDEFDRLHISGCSPLDLKGYIFDVYEGIDHVVLDNVNHLTINGNARRTSIQTQSSGNDLVINAGDGDDNLIIAGNNNVVRGGGGNDWLSGGGGSNTDGQLITTGTTFYGGPGDDFYGVGGQADKFVELPNEGTDTLSIYIDNYTLSEENSANMERVVLFNERDPNGNYPAYNINGSGGADTITGNDADNTIDGRGNSDTLNGGNGNDVLQGDAPPSAAASMFRATPASIASAVPGGSDKLDGGPGNDTAAFSGARSEYTVNYNSSSHVYTVSDTVAGRDGTDTVKNVEFFSFSDGTKPAARILDTQLTGTEGADKLVGNIGYDELHGLGGNDTLSGLAGDDLLDGGIGADIMSGGDGNDSYIVDETGDKVKETAKAGSGTDTVYTSLPSYTLPLNVENLAYTGASNFSGKGNKSSNRMYGGPAADKLDGQKGVDVMAGGAGDDTYLVDSTSDLVNEDPDAGFDQVTSSVTITTLSQNVEVLTLSKGNVNGTGNALDNVIIGSTSNNILSGGDGADTLIGGMGNDTFYGETAASPGDDADTIFYGGAKKGVVFSLANTLAAQKTGGAGTDRIHDISGIENLTGTSFPDNLTGSAVANIIHGSDSNDLIYGLSGADVLFGDAGLDAIDCGSDGDVDRVAYVQPTDSPVGPNRDQVSNFNAGNDVVDLTAMDANVSVGGDEAFVFNHTTPQANSVWYVVSGTDVIVQGDVNGDAAPDFEVLVKGVASLAAGNFAL